MQYNTAVTLSPPPKFLRVTGAAQRPSVALDAVTRPTLAQREGRS